MLCYPRVAHLFRTRNSTRKSRFYNGSTCWLRTSEHIWNCDEANLFRGGGGSNNHDRRFNDDNGVHDFSEPRHRPHESHQETRLPHT